MKLIWMRKDGKVSKEVERGVMAGMAGVLHRGEPPTRAVISRSELTGALKAYFGDSDCYKHIRTLVSQLGDGGELVIDAKQS